jgi:hypothetical protein
MVDGASSIDSRLVPLREKASSSIGNKPKGVLALIIAYHISIIDRLELPVDKKLSLLSSSRSQDSSV